MSKESQEFFINEKNLKASLNQAFDLDAITVSEALRTKTLKAIENREEPKIKEEPIKQEKKNKFITISRWGALTAAGILVIFAGSWVYQGMKGQEDSMPESANDQAWDGGPALSGSAPAAAEEVTEAGEEGLVKETEQAPESIGMAAEEAPLEESEANTEEDLRDSEKILSWDSSENAISKEAIRTIQVEWYGKEVQKVIEEPDKIQKLFKLLEDSVKNKNGQAEKPDSWEYRMEIVTESGAAEIYVGQESENYKEIKELLEAIK